MLNQIIQKALLIRRLLLLIYREKYNKEIFKPKVINFNANDICNSKCTMCNIWQQKQTHEITPEELETVLRDPLYKQVDHIGITGGEPTLREDLHLLYESAIKAIPTIGGLSIITNAIKKDEVISRVDNVIRTCNQYGKSFSMMVSLDGHKDIHDLVRGREGNFDSALEVINYFKNKDISVTIGATISKVNVWDIEELLYFLRKKGWYGRFRVAEFINRLYNDDRKDVIRNFDDDEKYQLCLFFSKLISDFETDETYKRTYRSIINILRGGERLIGCPYQSKGLSLNSRGELAYCAPKSKIIGNGITESSVDIYNNSIDERARIIENDCKSCIHDYHAPITSKELILQYKSSFWRRYLTLNHRNVSVSSFIGNRKSKAKQAFIVGWYGTETVGDKAILGGIIDELKAEHGEIDIVIGSLIPFITERTVKELAVVAKVIDVYSAEFINSAKYSDLVIMGGGPLMDLEVLAIPLHAFLIGKKHRRKNIIYGCGLGPLYEEKFLNATKELLTLADEIKLRDYASIELAKKWGLTEKHIKYSGDPSRAYLTQFKIVSNSPQNVIRCYLRDWTHEYSKDISHEEFLVLKIKFETSLANLIKKKAIAMGADEIVFEHMHNFVVGNDDRDFSRRFIETYFLDFKIKVSYNKYLSTVASICESMQSSKHNICMRFHSVVFAHTLRTDFTAIDYTKGGKILNFLTDENELDKLITIENLLLNENCTY